VGEHAADHGGPHRSARHKTEEVRRALRMVKHRAWPSPPGPGRVRSSPLTCWPAGSSFRRR
jgi:hypothetical protein